MPQIAVQGELVMSLIFGIKQKNQIKLDFNLVLAFALFIVSGVGILYSVIKRCMNKYVLGH